MEPTENNTSITNPSIPSEDKRNSSTWHGRTITVLKEVPEMILRIFEVTIAGLLWAVSTCALGTFNFIFDDGEKDSDPSGSIFSPLVNLWRKLFGPSYPEHSYLIFKPDTSYRNGVTITSDTAMRPGMPNNGSDCFMNSVIQCLKGVHVVLKKKQDPFIQEFVQKIETKVPTVPDSEETATKNKIANAVRDILPLFDSTEDQTTQLREINQNLRKWAHEINSQIKMLSFSDAQEFYSVLEGALQFPSYKFHIHHELQIKKDESVKNDDESVAYITVKADFPDECPPKGLHLTNLALKPIIKRDQFIMKNQIIPNGTIDYQTLELEQLDIEENDVNTKNIPSILPIHLTRFRNMSNKSYKIFNEVEYSDTLDIPIKGKNECVRYRFNSCVVHYGDSTDNLHYIAYCQEEDKLVMYNDDKQVGAVTEDSKEAAKKDIMKYGYLFFYVYDSIGSVTE